MIEKQNSLKVKNTQHSSQCLSTCLHHLNITYAHTQTVIQVFAASCAGFNYFGLERDLFIKTGLDDNFEWE